jgi:hypothetical protein
MNLCGVKKDTDEIIFKVEPIPDVRLGCVRRKLTQVQFYISRNFSKFNSFFCNSLQEKLQNVFGNIQYK